MLRLSRLMNKFRDAKYADDIKNEYTKIVLLEVKRRELMSEIGDEVPYEISVTQRNILRNNFISLAHIVKDRDILKNNVKDISKGYYFNIQGTNPRVLLTKENLSPMKITDKTGNHSSFILRIDTALSAKITQDMIKLENILINLKSKEIRKEAKNKLVSLAEKKIVKKVHAFCNKFKGNEQLFKDYIFSGLSGLNEDDHWHNYELMKLRLNFIGLLYYNANLFDSESFEIAPKEVIYVYNEIKGLEIEKFLNKIKTNKYDFIITEEQ